MRVFRKPSDATPANVRHIAPLAKLPVFFDLAGKRAVLAGGGEAAAWKAELLSACGAHVEIHAGDAEPEMRALIARGAEPGTLTLVERAWTPADIEGAAIALCDAEDDGEAARFAQAARAAGVPVNVIDNPTFCDFQFGSIVNRSPVIVSISTDGAAPILGQAIRRRIETLLPAALGPWATAAKGYRSRLMDLMPDASRRRAFWERFADKAFAARGGETVRAELDAMAGNILAAATPHRGHVTLVGAGPGDAELLTLKAVRALQSADVILFDALVSDEVLELARREAKRMLVGKRGGKRSCRQEDINALMVKFARDGKRVVRLKSGDPMVFGRAGEEVAELDAAEIPVDVVPGVSAVFSLAAELGVSLTHRDHAHSLRLVTGHASDGGMPKDLDWRGLSDAQTTLVIYMGGRTAQSIATRMIGEGRAPETPVVIAAKIGRPDRQLSNLSLAQLASGAFAREDDGPVLIGVGEVFAMRKAMALLDGLPEAIAV
ncbi:siroheme synthase CysG [Breoghania sp. L-A4]|uniref:siroheme synthase CysG n=1 Tax=Breoghania sp. L-A4 TaxID=2304600 RepID=UPI000E35DF79|nr:siroheme synthase CysG [Breoghania sp. L-A4]AXS42149.1 uroporphyrinogen-III C-methyltransferase [Breoghania sp. L-A4]